MFARGLFVLLLSVAPWLVAAAPSASDWDQALRTGDSNRVEAWLTAGVKPDVRNEEGDLPIHLAATYGHAGLVLRLLQAADDGLNATNGAGETPLFRAVYWGRLEALEALMPLKPDLSLRYDRRVTILIAAVKRNQYSAVKILLKWAPPLEEEDEDGLTARGWARRQLNRPLEELLRLAGALEPKGPESSD